MTSEAIRNHGRDASPIQVSVSDLPKHEIITFEDSSFFVRHGKDSPSPSPAEVRDRARADGFKYPHWRLPPVRFKDLGLLVKAGSYITIAEGQCLWAIRRFLGDQLPVPEVYGWCRDGNEVFIYMELIEGATLNERWGELTSTERTSVCGQLRSMLSSSSRLRQDPEDVFIGIALHRSSLTAWRC